MNKPQAILLHHSASPDGKVVRDADGIKKFHMSWRYNGNIITPEKASQLIAQGFKGVVKPWKNVGYHYLIEFVNNTAQRIKGRQEWESGAHCYEKGMNSKSIGICVVGYYDKVVPPEPLLDETVALCAELCAKYKIPPTKIETHHKYASYKTCPGTMFPMAYVIGEVTKLLK